ncbi:MAG TPA: cupredoxin domain-containing protein [Dongiaceae bacterium]|jgi:uncharacterized cupredoxin-like copper-binding protein
MNRMPLIFGLFAATLAISACSSMKSEEAAPAPVANTQGVVSATDWSKSQAIGVTLSSFNFTPTDFTFQHGQPYKLHLVNSEDETHTFNSDTLFQAIAVQKVVQNGSEKPGVTGNSIVLGPNEQADLYFVPVTAGSYKIYCDEFMHAAMGMRGNVTIQ